MCVLTIPMMLIGYSHISSEKLFHTDTIVFAYLCDAETLKVTNGYMCNDFPLNN